jgi:hypothetical protein
VTNRVHAIIDAYLLELIKAEVGAHPQLADYFADQPLPT